MSTPKQVFTVGVTPKHVDVIFVAKYQNDPTLTSTEVSTANFLAHAKKQEAASLALPTPVKTHIVLVETLGDIRRSLLGVAKLGEVVQRVDILAHGTEKLVGLSGVVTTDNVSFHIVTDIFDEATVLLPMVGDGSVSSGWQPDFAQNGEFLQTGGVGGWQDAVSMALADEATINVFACNSGGRDTSEALPKTIAQEGLLLDGIAKLFVRPAVGFGAYLFWVRAPTTSVNLYTFLLGVPLANQFFVNAVHGRQPQNPLVGVPLYRDLVTVTRVDFPAIPFVVKPWRGPYAFTLSSRARRRAATVWGPRPGRDGRCRVSGSLRRC